MDAYSGIDSHSSPRTRRYFPRRASRGPPGFLFSAHAEVFPRFMSWRRRSLTLLRARGGISIEEGDHRGSRGSSPRTRRYFRLLRPPQGDRFLFSAHAEVFPRPSVCCRSSGPLLRARGGISKPGVLSYTSPNSSPRTRRYFRYLGRRQRPLKLFSAHAEVFPRAGRN